jgi:uncharacterized protein YwgA
MTAFDIDDVVVGVVALSGGRVVGKTRLQKEIYFLQRCGLNVGLDFDYHHFGPYSSELAQATDDAVAFERLNAENRQGYHEVPYTVYTTEEAAPKKLAGSSQGRIEEKLRVMKGYSALELEVAATIDYLREAGYGERAIAEAKTRKPLKATPDRIMRAMQLLRELGLQ